MLRRILVFCFALGLLASPALAADPATPDTTTPAAQAEALFKEGKIAEARDAFAEALKADPENAELERRHQVLSRVLEMETAIQEQDPSPKWERMVCTLHAFYLRSDLHEKALALDTSAHERIDSAITGSLVLETMLEMNENQKALAFAEGLREGQMTDANRILKGIAAARLGKMEMVREDMELYGAPAATDAGLHYDLARLHALMGEKDGAMASLKAAFENCPPKGIETLKMLATTSPDFRSLHGEAFQQVLETPSQVSDCGGCGSGCGCSEKKDGDCCGSCDGAAKSEGCCGSCDGAAKADGCCGGCEGAKSGDCSGCPAANK